MPQRLLVPLFQRPCVWNDENQWADVTPEVDRRYDYPPDNEGSAIQLVLEQAELLAAS